MFYSDSSTLKRETTPSLLQIRNRVLLSRHTSLPLVLGRNVLVQRILLALGAIKVLAICSAGNTIVIPEETTLAQLREQEIDDVLEGLWEEGIRLDVCQS